jgi:hypothetical protein
MCHGGPIRRRRGRASYCSSGPAEEPDRIASEDSRDVIGGYGPQRCRRSHEFGIRGELTGHEGVVGTDHDMVRAEPVHQQPETGLQPRQSSPAVATSAMSALVSASANRTAGSVSAH